MNLKDLQEEHSTWLARNFPGQVPYQALLGVVEEVGELSHAHLKMEQGIRGEREKLRYDKIDAIADIIIFLCGYCTGENISLDDCVTTTWEKVKQRDWASNPSGEGFN